MIEFLRKFLMGVSLACLGGGFTACEYRPKPPAPTVTPTPVPTPTPTPTPVVSLGRPMHAIFLELLLRSEGGKWVRDNKPFSYVGAIPCWPPDNADGTPGPLIVDGKKIEYMWPLASEQWIDHIASKGANGIHLRPGPIGAADTIAELQAIGGPYLPDGSDWNPKFWERFHTIIRYAGSKGVNVEIDGLDGWVVKNSIAGSWHMPFPEEDVFTALQLPINPSVRKWIKKLTYETCLYGHKTYQIGNETGVSGHGWTPEWERAMYGLIREGEQQPGCDGEVIAMIGSNSRDYDGPYDFFVSHQAEALTAPISNRPTEVNEYNPALAPAQFKSLMCSSRRAGQSFWYWRSDGSDAWQDASLNLLKGGCGAASTCPDPKPDRAKLDFTMLVYPNGIVDATPIVTKDCEYCSAIGMGEINGTPRCACPIRNECPGFDCENRLTCEQYVLSVPGVCSATAPTWHTDGTLLLVDQYGFRARTDGTWLEACNCDSSICRRVEL